MFSLATAKGRFSSIAVVGLALTMAACPGPDGLDEGTEAPSPATQQDVQEPSPSPSPSTAASAGSGDGSILAVPTPLELVFGPCHDSNAEGGNSDGWLMFLFTGVFPSESTLAADVTMENGASDTYVATFIEPDRGVVAFPLDFFEQEVTLDQVTVDGEPIVLPDEWETTFTVSPESNCEYLPSFYEEL